MSISFGANNVVATPSGPVVQIMNSIGEQRGGLTKSVYQRFSQLATNRRAILITLAFQSDLHSTFSNLKEEGLLPPHTELINFHHDISSKKLSSSVSRYKYLCSLSALKKEIKVVEPGGYFRFFKSGSFTRLIKINTSGGAAYADIHDQDRPWLRIMRIIPPTDSYPGLAEHYDNSQRIKYREFLNENWKPYVSSWVNDNNWEYRSVNFSEFPLKITPSLEVSKRKWLQDKLSLYKNSVVYTDETTTLFALSIPPKNFSHVTTVHTIHYADSSDKNSGFRGWWYRYQNQTDNLDTVVAFTDMQSEDLKTDLHAENTKFKVALHVAAEPTLTSDSRKNLVVVSRLSSEKRIDHAVTAFSKIAAKNPDQSLLIYGIGAEADNLSKLIKQLGMEKQIQLMGFVKDPLEVFKTAICSVSTSKYEGFGLTTLESFTVGTPVLSYDVIYGSKHLIKDGINGFLVADCDIDKLAQMMNRLLNGDVPTDLNENCVKTALEYSFDKWAERWESIHEDAVKSITS